MSQDCLEHLEKLRRPEKTVLDQYRDLASLSAVGERRRREMHNKLKANKQELIDEFIFECPKTLEGDQQDVVRSRFELARLMIVASFAWTGDGIDIDQIPVDLQGEFPDMAIETVGEFERYKQFSELDEDQINRRIRRLEGEVYELVKEYTSTQLSDLDDLLESSDVPGDIMRRLSERYDDRLEKMRQGFYMYVEEQGMVQMIGAIEDAMETVSEAQETSAKVDQELAAKIDHLSEQLSRGFERQEQQRRRELQAVERELASSSPDLEAIDRKLESLNVGTNESHNQALKKLQRAIAETESLREDLESNLDKLHEVREDSGSTGTDELASQVASIVDSEVAELETQREEVSAEIERLQQERTRLEASREHVQQRQQELQERINEIESSVSDDEGGLDGESVVTPTVARLLEMDYIGRFETSVHEARSIRLREEARKIPEGYWESRSERRNERPRLAEFLNESQNPEQFPVNTSARFTIDSSGFLGLGGSAEMVLEAAVCSDLEALATNGFDASPATLDDLLEHVNQSVYEAEMTEVDILLGIASPTGWSDSVREQIMQGELARTKYSRRLSIVLVDARTGELTYDASDPVASENARLFELPIDEELLADCEAAVEGRFDTAGFASEGVILDTVVEEDGYSPHIVKRTFDRLSARPEYEQQYVDTDLVLFES
ncbi:coiled-coil domain-containing protein [Salinigranum halophilum]|uniref:hypothetical protein n=1 Tax=Salinigranum halophilum TaxID=2565931 RepID=UPI0013756B01|nr:hypothetical protein [Salinigranum halophilum]